MMLDEIVSEISYVVLNPVQGQWEAMAMLADDTAVWARGHTVAEALQALGQALIALKA